MRYRWLSAVVVSLLAVLSPSCASRECTVQQASYDFLGFCDGRALPDHLVDFAADVREQGGVVIIGALGSPSRPSDPELFPATCDRGVCLASARVAGDILVSDGLREGAVELGDEIRATAPASRAPLFTSDEVGTPRCPDGEWLPSEGVSSECFPSNGFLMPRAGDRFAFFLGPIVDGARELRWSAQTVGVAVSGEGTLSGLDVGTAELTRP